MLDRMAKKPLSLNNPDELRTALRDWRERNGLSQRDAAPVLGFSVTAVALWESGKRFPRWKTLATLREKLGV